MKTPLRILHLEDNPEDVALVQSVLETGGVACSIIRVQTRDDYMAALERGNVDLILSDFPLPDFDGLKALEKECLANNARFKNWECDEKKMKLTRGGEALYLHCLPADISGVSCAQGEVSAGVFEKYRIATYREASFKPFVIAAMIYLARVKSPLAALGKLIK